MAGWKMPPGGATPGSRVMRVHSSAVYGPCGDSTRGFPRMLGCYCWRRQAPPWQRHGKEKEEGSDIVPWRVPVQSSEDHRANAGPKYPPHPAPPFNKPTPERGRADYDPHRSRHGGGEPPAQPPLAAGSCQLEPGAGPGEPRVAGDDKRGGPNTKGKLRRFFLLPLDVRP